MNDSTYIYISGPRLFLTCPMDITASQIWFIDLWNYSIIPYMLEAVREGLQVRFYLKKYRNILVDVNDMLYMHLFSMTFN